MNDAIVSENENECEIWKAIIGYEGCYEVSNRGRVRTLRTSTKRKRLMKLNLDTNHKYYRVGLSFCGETKFYRVNRLVAQAFLPNYYCEGLLVDHIDRNPRNNWASNLRMTTHKQNSYNCSHSTRSQWKMKGVRKKKGKMTKPWEARIQQDGKSTYLGYYESEELAGRAYDKKALALFGEHACTNEMLGHYAQ